MPKLPCPHIEIHVMHTCNLACSYCTHFCDMGYTGKLEFSLGAEWIRGWSERLEPGVFRLLGGEPLLHDRLADYIRLASEIFPSAKREVVTNGLLLRNIEDILPLFIETGTGLVVSLHPVSPSQERVINDAQVLLAKWHSRGLAAEVSDSPDVWYWMFEGSGAEMRPAKSNPEKAFAACPNKICSIIHEGKLFKCAQLAFLPLIADKLLHRDEWDEYLGHRPLSVDASDEKISAYLDQPSPDCSMCLESVAHKDPPCDKVIPFNVFKLVKANNTLAKRTWRKVRHKTRRFLSLAIPSLRY